MPLAQPLSSRLARLRERLAARLPEEAEQDPSLIWAAVAVVLVPDPDAILLIRRADRVGDPWSGHMALPGGRRGTGDADLTATAMREAHEEVGLVLDRADLAGSLEDVVPRLPVLPPIAVRPAVFFLPERLPLVPNGEVAAATWISLDHLLKPDVHRIERLNVGGEPRNVLAYRVDDQLVWGMTERILSSLFRDVRLSS